jgi:hypothetical protein
VAAATIGQVPATAAGAAGATTGQVRSRPRWGGRGPPLVP